MSLHPVLTALLAAALFGAATPACKPLLAAFSSFQLAGLLYLGAALATFPVLLLRGEAFSPLRMDRRNRGLLLSAVGWGGFLGPVLLLCGLKAASAASVSLWLNLELAATAVLGALFFKDKLGALGWAAAAGILAASATLAWGDGPAARNAGLWVAAACLCWGADNQCTALIDGMSPAGTTFWKGAIAGTFNLVLGLEFSPWLAAPGQIAWALAVGALAYGASIALYISAAQRIGATRGQLLFSSAPFFGVLFSWLLLAERLTVYHAAAGAILVASLGLLAGERHEHSHAHAEQEHSHAHSHDDPHHAHEHPEGAGAGVHSHPHRHRALTHAHRHWPDLHHRH
ncbi:MAG TPA: EamA family transporter [Elusimicrobia bacterium]|nr:EamA family transporter [Elusimicrobiota bacterium]